MRLNARKISLVAVCAIAIAACNPTETPIPTTPTPPPSTPAAQISGSPVRVGILNIDSAVSVNERYAPLLHYLEEKTGHPFQMVPLTQESQFAEVAAGNLDFVVNNPLAAVQLRRLYDTDFLVTHSRPKTGTQFGGSIIVRRDRAIETLEDLKGKKAACVDFQTAAAGCVFQIDYLKQRGFNPFKDFSRFVENESQDNIVLAVLNGTVDVGFIRTGQLERMVEKGLIESVDVVKILNPAEDNFAYSHTTALYPEWTIAALKETDPQLKAEVKTALLNIPPDRPELKAARIEGFIPAADYSELDRLIENLKLKSWDIR
ncbi:phosphate/phosphite/phosphonate ABC transporter substrate-binding protein [Lusitaniella coriacea]|uniref:phosphate/phosphite/phosphonate ABC transporter substrate-binding protein n=1 Tax=Lusitaniella coriacea TaxID=1983105 RepID=UPI003CFA5BAE